MNPNTFGFQGLTEDQVVKSRRIHGSNVVQSKSEGLFQAIVSLLQEPMLLLLVTACTIYFITGQSGDAIFMLCAIVLTTSISLYQDHRSKKALRALQSITRPECRVIRAGIIETISLTEVVVGDYLLAEEGATVAADGIVIHSNDFSLSEAILTGESFPVTKTISEGNNLVYQGTLVTRGLAIIKVSAIGDSTELGKIGKSIQDIIEEETPLQVQIRVFVRRMAFVGVAFFLAVWAINFVRSRDWLDSLLKSLSLAMSILPEEIPVAFTTFMALGAWRLAKLGIIVKRTSTIETLGSASVICVDKTGTITKNQMELTAVYTPHTGTMHSMIPNKPETGELIRMAMWASEPIPFDPMEIALHSAYGILASPDERPLYRMVHEYPLAGNPPFMTHVFENNAGQRIISAKGAPEAIMDVCKLDPDHVKSLRKTVDEIASSGSRVLGVAIGRVDGDKFPDSQRDIDFTFMGFVAFYDPPKENMKSVIQSFYKAGIQVKIITGDLPQTAMAIATEISLEGAEKVVTGKELMRMDDIEVRKVVEDKFVFARMFPDAKLKILNALKGNGHIVAMTGDGVNDGPALKGAHIGVAMGKKGTQIAKEVSSMILSDDDLAKMVDAVAAGRKIYANLKKAIQYIISIHIPIILVVFIPLILNWIYPVIFTPVHVIFLEMVMGPTCSVIYENEPLESWVMLQKPRPVMRTFFAGRELAVSILQGLVISAGVTLIYLYSVGNLYNEELTRSMVFATMISANVFLTLVNRSTVHPVWVSIRYRNTLIPIVISITLALTGIILYARPVTEFFNVFPLSFQQLLLCAGTGFLSTTWIEVVKVARSARY